MNQEMSTLFPNNGIRVLVVDDDERFLSSSCMMLSLLNFKVATCGSPVSALKHLINRERFKDFDVVLISAEMAAACGFNFRGIVEQDLRIPVVYYMSLGHKEPGNETDELQRTLRAATFTIKKPLDAEDICNLWRVIAWRKSDLEDKANKAGCSRVVPDAAVEALMAGSSIDEETEEAEEIIQFKMVRAGRGWKRSSVLPASQERQGKKAPKFQQPPQPGQQHHQQKSSFVQPVLSTPDMPPYSNTAAPPALAPPPLHPVQPPALALPPLVNPSQAPAPAQRAVNPLPAPAPPPAQRLVHHQQQCAARNVFGAMAPSAAAVATMADTITCEPQFSQQQQQQQQQQDMSLPPMLGPFPYQGPRPPVVQQNMFAAQQEGQGSRGTGRSTTLSFQLPQAGHPFRANPPPVAPQHVGVGSNQAAIAAPYDNYCYRSLMGHRHVGHGVAAGTGAGNGGSFINYNAGSLVPPQHAGHGVEVVMEAALNSNNFSNRSTGSLMAHEHILGMASNVNEIAMAGGAFGGGNAASTMAPQDLVAAPNGNQLAPGALMGPQGPAGAPMDAGNTGFDAVLPADENTMFPPEDLLDLDDPIWEAGEDDQQGVVAAGTGATADAAGTSMNGGGGGMGIWDIGADDSFEMPDDFLVNKRTGDVMFPNGGNNGRK